MGEQQLPLNLPGGDTPGPGCALRFSHTQQNHDLTVFLDGVIRELVGRMDLQPLRAPSEARRLRRGIAQADHQAPKRLADLRVEDVGLRPQPLGLTGGVDGVTHPVHILLYNGVLHHCVGCHDVYLFRPLFGFQRAEHLKRQLAQQGGILAAAEPKHPRPLVVEIDRPHFFHNLMKLFKHLCLSP